MTKTFPFYQVIHQLIQFEIVYYVTTSKLALEYTRLGKHARGGAMFSHIQEALQKPESSKFLSDNDIGEITLRYAMHLIWTGNIEESQVDRCLL